MEINDELYYEKEKLKNILKWSDINKSKQFKISFFINWSEKVANDIIVTFILRFSQLNANGDQILFLDNNKTVKIYSIIEKKWVFSYVVTLIR